MCVSASCTNDQNVSKQNWVEKKPNQEKQRQNKSGGVDTGIMKPVQSRMSECYNRYRSLL